MVGLDHFFDMFPQDWDGHRRGPGPGFWQDIVTDPDGKPRIITHHARSCVQAALGQDEVSERGVLTASDELWEVAVRQAAVVSRLVALL